MPQIQSAKKALRQNVRRRERNLKRKKMLSEAVKELRGLVAAGKINEAAEYLPKTYKTIDKMAKVNLIKKGRANRMKSRLARALAARKTTAKAQNQ